MGARSQIAQPKINTRLPSSDRDWEDLVEQINGYLGHTITMQDEAGRRRGIRMNSLTATIEYREGNAWRPISGMGAAGRAGGIGPQGPPGATGVGVSMQVAILPLVANQAVYAIGFAPGAIRFVYCRGLNLTEGASYDFTISGTDLTLAPQWVPTASEGVLKVVA